MSSEDLTSTLASYPQIPRKEADCIFAVSVPLLILELKNRSVLKNTCLGVITYTALSKSSNKF